MTENWFKSSYTTPANNCVETRFSGRGDRVDVRDSKDVPRGYFTVGGEAWQAFVSGCAGDSTD